MHDDDASVRLSDHELAVLRQLRFGELPARARPEEWIEETETDPPDHELERTIPIVQNPGVTYGG